MIRTKFFIILLLLCSTATVSVAADEVLTKKEAIRNISATDFMKKKIGELISWTVGYDISKVNRVRMTPNIKYVKASPVKVPPDGRTIFEIVASVEDPGGSKNIEGVRADLSSLGRLPNTALVDNGLYGDRKRSDGIYTLQASVARKVKEGSKEVPIAVANKKGWLALAKTNLKVSKDPVIVGAEFDPAEAKADGQSLVVLRVKIENPGRIEDVNNVNADLRALGYPKLLSLHNDGLGRDEVAGDNIFTLSFTVNEDIKAGKYSIRIAAANIYGGYAYRDLELRIY